MNASEILKKHEDANEMHFHEVDRKWIIKAMEEYAALRKPPVSGSLPHESQIESALDKLLIIRGEHPARVRNPLYGEERQLAIDLVKYVLLSNER